MLLWKSSTSTPTPTATFPDAASDPATETIEVSSLALTARSPPLVAMIVAAGADVGGGRLVEFVDHCRAGHADAAAHGQAQRDRVDVLAGRGA